MIRKLLLSSLLTGLLFSSCVSSKVFKDLEGKYADLQQENEELSEELRNTTDKAEQDLAALQGEYDAMLAERDQLQRDLNAAKENYVQLQQSYDALEANSSSAIAENSKRNRELLAQLDEKESALRAEKERLEQLEKDLAARSQRVDELEGPVEDGRRRGQGRRRVPRRRQEV